jgi:hypothetical protein
MEAALAGTPRFVQVEVERLVPQLGIGGVPIGRWDSGYRETLFAAVGQLLAAAAAQHPLVLVVEDVHWADGGTLDCLTFLARRPRESDVTVVATCRGDDSNFTGHAGSVVARQLQNARGCGYAPCRGMRSPSRSRVLTGASEPARVVDQLYARSGGIPSLSSSWLPLVNRRPRMMCCQRGWPNCWRHGCSVAVGRRTRWQLHWPWLPVHLTRDYWVKSAILTRTRHGAGCVSSPNTGCWRTHPQTCNSVCAMRSSVKR